MLFARPQHLTADQILHAVNARNANAPKATVYNTLRLFVARGLLREVVVDSARIVYDCEVAPHHYFYDIDSGEVTDVAAAGVSVSGLPEIPSDKVLGRIDLVLRVRSVLRTPR